MSRRQISTAITLLALCGLVALGLVVGVKTLLKPVPGLPSGVPAAEPSPTCAPKHLAKGERLRSKQIEVSVFNAGGRFGLAGQTLDQLGRRGFQLGEIGNAEHASQVHVVQIWTTEKNDGGAKLVARQFGKHARVYLKTKNQDLGPGVDVVVGNGFRGLVPAPTAVRVAKAQRFCLSSTPSATGAADGG
jgi:hypothetical protein